MTAEPSPAAVRPDPSRPQIAVLVGSVRDERTARPLAQWAAERTAEVAGEVDVVDLARLELPPDRLLQPGGGVRSPITERLESADGFVFVCPEYNHSYPACLKRVIDWHYREWGFKAATVLSYGVRGGLLATEHLRGVLAELHVVTTRRTVGLQAPWTDVDAGRYAAPAEVTAAFDSSLRELAWWSCLLRSARRERALPW